MSGVATRTTWDVIKTCLVPDVQFMRRGYEVESIDGVDHADCWHFEVEWLGLHFQMAGGAFKPGAGQ